MRRITGCKQRGIPRARDEAFHKIQISVGLFGISLAAPSLTRWRTRRVADADVYTSRITPNLPPSSHLNSTPRLLNHRLRCNWALRNVSFILCTHRSVHVRDISRLYAFLNTKPWWIHLQPLFVQRFSNKHNAALIVLTLMYFLISSCLFCYAILFFLD